MPGSSRLHPVLSNILRSRGSPTCKGKYIIDMTWKLLNSCRYPACILLRKMVSYNCYNGYNYHCYNCRKKDLFTIWSLFLNSYLLRHIYWLPSFNLFSVWLHFLSLCCHCQPTCLTIMSLTYNSLTFKIFIFNLFNMFSSHLPQSFPVHSPFLSLNLPSSSQGSLYSFMFPPFSKLRVELIRYQKNLHTKKLKWN